MNNLNTKRLFIVTRERIYVTRRYHSHAEWLRQQDFHSLRLLGQLEDDELYCFDYRDRCQHEVERLLIQFPVVKRLRFLEENNVR